MWYERYFLFAVYRKLAESVFLRAESWFSVHLKLFALVRENQLSTRKKPRCGRVHKFFLTVSLPEWKTNWCGKGRYKIEVWNNHRLIIAVSHWFTNLLHNSCHSHEGINTRASKSRKCSFLIKNSLFGKRVLTRKKKKEGREWEIFDRRDLIKHDCSAKGRASRYLNIPNVQT